MAKDNQITTSFNVDISDLKKGIQEAQRQIRLANAEFKAAASGMDQWDKSTEGIQAKLKQLNSVLDNQKKILQSYKDQLEVIVKEQGEESKGADELRIKIANQQAAINETTKEIGKWEDALDDAGKELDDDTKKTDEFGDALNDTTKGGLSAFTVALGNLAADVIRDAVQGLKDLAKQTIEVGKEFDASMSKVGAVSGATGSELLSLRDKAKEMGATTKFTATEAAEAFNYMAMAGWKTEDMLNGIEGVLNLAAASGADLATTSDIVTDALTAMGYSAQDAGHLADVMAAAASNANTNVEMMGATFQYAAPIVGALGLNMEDTAVAIGLMANAGIKGEKAGTALRAILTRISTDAGASSKKLGALGTLTDELGVQFYDSSGKVRDLSVVLDECRTAWAGLSAEQQTSYGKQIAGQEALSAWLAIMNAAPSDVQKLTDAINGADGAAESMAATMMDNLAGDMTLFQSKLESTQIMLYEKFEPALRNIVDAASGFLDFMQWLIDNGAEVAAVITSCATAIGTFMLIVNKTAILAAFTKGITALKAAFIGLNAIMAANPIGLIISLVAGLLAGILVLWKNSEGFRQFFYDLWAGIKLMISDALSVIVPFFENLWATVQELWTGAQAFFAEVWENIKGFFTGAWESIQEIWGTLVEFFTGLWEGIQAVFVTIADWINENVFEPIKEFFQPVVQFFTEAWNIIKELAVGCWNAIKLVWGLVKAWFNTNVIQPVKQFFTDLWNTIKNAAKTAWDFIKGVWTAVSSWFKSTVIDPVANFFKSLWEGIKNAAKTAWEFVKGIWTAVSTWFKTTVIDPVAKVFTGMWDGLKKGASDAWEGIKKVFSVITTWFHDKFAEAWGKVKEVFSAGGKVFDGIKDGIVNAFKTVVNALIKGINKIIAIPFNAINGMLEKIQKIEIAGVKPFEKVITRFTVPQIPELAQGGILRKGQVGLLEGDGAEAVVPLDQNKRWISATARALRFALIDEGMISTTGSGKSLVTNNYNFTQNNTSPKALSRLEIYRQTNNVLQFARGV